MKKEISNKIKYNFVVRNVMLAVSIILILIISAFMFLDIYTKHGEKFTVPNLSGLTIAEAKKVTHTMGCRFVVIDSLFIQTQKAGAILEQNPKPGSYIKSNRRVMLTVNTMSPRKISMPYVAGYSLRQAKNRLISLGIGISNIIFQEDIATNNVIAQNYNGVRIEKNGGETIAVGEELELIVGLATDEEPTKVPNIIGNSIAQAKSTLWENGFNVGSIVLDSNIKHDNINVSVIFNQSVLPMILLPQGSTIDIFVTLDGEKVSQMRNKIRTRQRNIDKNRLNISGYLDTLNHFKTEEGRAILDKNRLKISSRLDTLSVSETDEGEIILDTIRTIDTVVVIQDSIYYKSKLFELELFYEMLMNNLEIEEIEIADTTVVAEKTEEIE